MAGERTISIKFDGSAAGFARAAKRAERALADVERKSGKTQDTLAGAGAGAARGFLGQMATNLAEAGPKLFGKTGPLGVVAIPAAVFLATAMAAAMSAALTAGLAAGVAGLGVMLAAQNPRVKAAFSSLGDDIKSELATAASVFVAPVERSIGRIRAAFNNMNLRGIFASASRYVEPLVQGMLGFAQKVLPGIQRAIDRAAPVIAVIQRNLPRIGDAISDAFDKISGNSREAAGGLEYVFTVLEEIIRGGATFISFLTQAFGWMLKVAEAGAAVGDTLLGWVPILGDQIDKGRANIDRIKASMEGAKTAGDDWKGGTIELTSAGKLASAAQEKMWQRTKVLTGSMEDAIDAAGGLSQAFMLLNGGTLNAREAERNYQAAIDDVTASIKENGKSLNDNTAKGRANNQAIDNLITATDRKARATYDEVAATKGAGAAQAAATKVYQDGRAELIKVGEKLFGNKKKAIEWADSIMQVPKNWTTTVGVATKTATNQLKTFQRKIDGLHGKTVIVTVQERRAGHHVSGPGGSGTLTRRWGGIDYAMARGGALMAHITRNPTVLFGERETGGEAYIPRRGDRDRSRRIAEMVVRRWLGGDVVWGGGRARRTGPAAPAAGGAGGNTYNINLRAYSDRFSLSQVMQDLAMHGAH